jgi:hypothetical protein
VCAAGSTQIVNHSNTIVVVPPGGLPALAQQQGIAFHLYSESGDGSRYLYIEQQQGVQLLVLDVTDPARIRMVANVRLTVSGPFDFVRTLGESALLISFRNRPGNAVLDLQNPRAPTLKAVRTLRDAGPTEALGDSAFMMIDQRRAAVAMPPRDYEVVDSSNPADPALLYTVKQVTSEIECDATGTTFLLGSDGLTIIRRPQVELSYKLAESSAS